MKQKGNWVDRLERKWGKYAVPNLMKYMVVLYIIGFVISAMDYRVFGELLTIDFAMILKGQVWRLVTFAIAPPLSFVGGTSLIFILFALLLYYSIGNTLEAVWGTFRFNLFYFGGLLACIFSALVTFVLVGSDYAALITTDYVFLSMFLAYAKLFPEEKFYIYFILPIKVKWLAIVDVVIILWEIMDAIRWIIAGGEGTRIGITTLSIIIFSMINFLVLFKAFKYRGITSSQIKKSKEYRKKVNKLSRERIHTCTECGITNKTNPDMEFRFCSRCDGNREYCMDHLFTHEHINKIVINIDKDGNIE